jgi:hypothetical protein
MPELSVIFGGEIKKAVERASILLYLLSYVCNICSSMFIGFLT